MIHESELCLSQTGLAMKASQLLAQGPSSLNEKSIVEDLSTYGDKRPNNGSKKEPISPRKNPGITLEGASVVPRCRCAGLALTYYMCHSRSTAGRPHLCGEGRGRARPCLGAFPRDSPSHLSAPAAIVNFRPHTRGTSQGTSLGGVPQEQKMLNGHLPLVMHHQVY